MSCLIWIPEKAKRLGVIITPLAESGKPFIFMNASGSLRDLETMVHEGGHAIHSFLSHPLKLNAFKSTPAEVAELASMSMELISMDGWNLFFTDEEELKRAKNISIGRRNRNTSMDSNHRCFSTLDLYQSKPYH